MYGGRVIDDFDRRVVKTYMGEYMGDFIFDTFQPFHFYNDDKVDYFIPRLKIDKDSKNEEQVAEAEEKKSKKKGAYFFCSYLSSDF